MIIGFDASRAFIKERTGTENYSYQLLLALSKIDRINQYIIYLRPFISDAAVPLMKFPKNFKLVRIPWLRLWTQGGLAIETFKDVLHQSKIDVLFIPAHTMPLLHRPGLKTVVAVHDLGSEYLPSMHQLKQRLYLGFMQKYQLKNATKIIAVSKATKDDLVKRIGINPEKIEVVYEGYDRNLFKLTKINVKVSSLIPYFLFVGTIQPRKNLARLIDAFARYSQSLGNIQSSKSLRSEDMNISVAPSLLIVGSKGWLSDDIYTLPKVLGIEDRVKFLGHVPDEKLPALYSGAEALLFPSLFEGFGLPLLEAQACGCPVLTSNVSSMPEVAGKSAILVNPESVDDIVRGMEKMEDGKSKMEIIKKGFENIKRFSWEKCAKETLKVLENV